MTKDPVIRFDSVSKSFGPLKVLDEVSFEVRKGQSFCILGRSGTGKSVTLRLMIGLIRPDSGGIHIHSDEVSSLKSANLSRVRKKVGFLFQYSALFDSISVGENVAFPLRRHSRLASLEIRRKAEGLLEQVGLQRQYDKMPGEISGGMRKRVGLARALALEPEILLVDEPSSGLDPITAVEIDKLLLELKQQRNTTLVVVTHNIPSVRRIGDVLALLHDGRILERGTPEDLEASPHELVRQFMTAQGGT